tara:strand:- start:12756 stop:13049 length:294 start_codon:yes stop_codon:yes gene_type:complete
MSNPVERSTPRTAGRRGKKGPDKSTVLLKDALIEAAHMAGSDKQGTDGLVGYCRFLATEEPRTFATLIGKVLPMQVTGVDNGPIKTRIEFAIVDPKE